MEDIIKKEIENILKETTQFDFPFLEKEEKKKSILQEKKTYVEEKLRSISPRLFPNDEKINEIWSESIEYADEQFKALPAKRRLNGFYLQELMYYYVEKLGDSIMSNN